MGVEEKEPELIEGRGYRGRGAVYRWLRKHHAFVETWVAKVNPAGDEIAARIARDGVLGAKGKPPTSRSVRKVLARVRRDVEAERKRKLEAEAASEAKAEARRLQPSRLIRDSSPLQSIQGTHRGGALVVASPREVAAPTQPTNDAKPWDDPKYTPEQAQRMKDECERLERYHEWIDRHNRSIPPERLAILTKEFSSENLFERLARRSNERK